MTPATLFLSLALLSAPASAPAQEFSGGASPAGVCSRDGAGNLLPGHREVAWPDLHPLWTLCMVRPVNSSATDGSGLEIYNVHYQGHLVFKRAHAPILNVLYATGCGCFRDWSDQERGFFINTTPTAAGYAETQKVLTVCENAGIDLGTFNGVASENRGNTELVLTTQMQAGWYRYVMRWYFYPDGKLVGWFGFAAVSANCVNFDHTHHNYWRLDFDIDGPGNDYIDVATANPAKPAPVASEAKALRGPAYWVVRDGATGRGYKLTPGTSVAPGSFGVSDLWFLRYKPNEIDDGGPGCAIQIDPFISGESLGGQDVVVWLRGGEFHAGGDFDHCGTVDFMLEPIGSW